MSFLLQIKRNTLSNIQKYVGKIGELVYSIDTFQLFVMDGETAGGKLIGTLNDYAPDKFMVANTANGHVHLKIKAGTMLKLTDATFYVVGTDYDFVATANLDTGATLTAGKDYYVYLVAGSDNVGKIVVSASADAPSGYTTYRKIGGFHTLCVDVGTITGHPLSGYTAGQILPNSVWCLNHRPSCESADGMVYDPVSDVWVDIYNMSTTGESKYGAARAHTMMHYQFSELACAWGKTLLMDEEFYTASKGSNQKTVVAGSAQPNPDTTGGRKDTAGRRMISWIGCEEMCGLQWQHLAEPSAAGGSNWNTQNGDEGLFYGSYMIRLAGGDWDHSSYCGSRCRHADRSLSFTYANHGARGRSHAVHGFV